MTNKKNLKTERERDKKKHSNFWANYIKCLKTSNEKRLSNKIMKMAYED